MNDTVEIKHLHLTSIHLKNFRCFEQVVIDLDSPIVLVYGKNGTGKTSVLEALYYGCYLRSFRTHTIRDLIALGKESFLVKFLIRDSADQDTLDHTIQIGFAHNKRLVKIDNKTTVSYKDLLSYYRAISLTEDDLLLIQGGPGERRSFLDAALLLENAEYMSEIKKYRIVLENRNALLENATIDKDIYFIWTKKLWEHTIHIQAARRHFLSRLESTINTMFYRYVDPDISCSLLYQAKKKSDCDFEEFLQKNTSLEELMRQEIYFRRSLFGAHLDDFTISLEGKKSRAYASRGQQKMIVLLVKIAQIRQLTSQSGPLIFLLDDFMIDFDIERGKALLKVLFELNCQLIFTSPRRDSALEGALIDSQKSYKIVSI